MVSGVMEDIWCNAKDDRKSQIGDETNERKLRWVVECVEDEGEGDGMSEKWIVGGWW